MNKKKKITVSFWIVQQNCGDGSAVAKFFRSEEKANKYASHLEERFCDDVYVESLDFDQDGNLLTPEPVIEE